MLGMSRRVLSHLVRGQSGAWIKMGRCFLGEVAGEKDVELQLDERIFQFDVVSHLRQVAAVGRLVHLRIRCT